MVIKIFAPKNSGKTRLVKSFANCMKGLKVCLIDADDIVASVVVQSTALGLRQNNYGEYWRTPLFEDLRKTVIKTQFLKSLCNLYEALDETVLFFTSDLGMIEDSHIIYLRKPEDYSWSKYSATFRDKYETLYSKYKDDAIILGTSEYLSGRPELYLLIRTFSEISSGTCGFNEYHSLLNFNGLIPQERSQVTLSKSTPMLSGSPSVAKEQLKFWQYNKAGFGKFVLNYWHEFYSLAFAKTINESSSTEDEILSFGLDLHS